MTDKDEGRVQGPAPQHQDSMTNNKKLQWSKFPARALAADTALAAEWDRLNHCRRDLPFLSAVQVSAAVESFGSGAELLLSGCDASGTTRAMLVLTPESAGKWRTFQPSQMPLGPWVSDGSMSVAEIARDVQRRALSACLVLSITQIDPWVEARPQTQSDNAVCDYIETGWIELQGSFEDYWASRSKDLRLNLRRRRNRLTEEGVDTELKMLTGAQDMAPAIVRYGAMESSGWKGSQGTAVHPDNAQGRYYARALELASASGEASVHDYRFGEKSVAMDLCMQRGDMLVVLKTSYDESLKQSSPAFMLREEQLQQLFSTGTIRRVEFYGRFMEWHSRWTDKKRSLYHYTQYRWPLLKSLSSLIKSLRSRAAPAPAPAPAAPSPTPAAAPASAH